MSTLFYTKQPKIINTALAMAIGLNEAIIAQQIYWFTTDGRGTKKEGHMWVYNTYEGWQEIFPWWHRDTIKRTLTRLEKAQIVIARNDFNKMKIDRTKWYRINFANPILSEEVSGTANLPPSNGAKCTDESATLPPSHQGNLHQPITIEEDYNIENNIEAGEVSPAKPLVKPMKKSGKKTSKTVSEVEDKIGAEILSIDEIFSVIAEKKPTITTLNWIWVRCMKFHEVDMGPFLGVTAKESCQIRDGYAKMVGDPVDRMQLIAKVVTEWKKFVEYAEVDHSVLNLPKYPAPWCVLKYAQVISAWGHQKEEIKEDAKKGVGKITYPKQFQK